MLSEFKNFINLFYYNLSISNHCPISREDFLKLPNHEEISNSVSLAWLGSDERRFSIREKLPERVETASGGWHFWSSPETEHHFRNGLVRYQTHTTSGTTLHYFLKIFGYYIHHDKGIQIFYQM